MDKEYITFEDLKAVSDELIKGIEVCRDAILKLHKRVELLESESLLVTLRKLVTEDKQ